MSLIRGLFNLVSIRAGVEPSLENGMQLLFRCPGCKMLHGPTVGQPNPHNQAVWSWNGDYEKPTFSPSLLVRYDHLSEAGRARCAEFHKEHGRYPTNEELPYDLHMVCHSFIGCNGAQPGQIIYLDDCTHALKGQTVDIPPYGDDDHD